MLMDQLDIRGSNSEIDLESGGTTSEDTSGGKDSNLGGANSKKQIHRVWSEFLGQESADGSAKGRQSLHSLSKATSLDELFVNKGETWLDKLREKKQKKPDSVRPPKPPRPPKRQALDAADARFIKEVSELAVLKRKRIERMKALRKKKKQKPSSMRSNILAVLVTAIFFFVIISQGLLGSRV